MSISAVQNVALQALRVEAQRLEKIAQRSARIGADPAFEAAADSATEETDQGQQAVQAQDMRPPTPASGRGSADQGGKSLIALQFARIQGVAAFKANAAVVKTANEVEQSALDIKI